MSKLKKENSFHSLDSEPNHEKALILLKTLIQKMIDNVNSNYLEINSDKKINLILNVDDYIKEFEAFGIPANLMIYYKSILMSISILCDKVNCINEKLENNLKYVLEIKSKFSLINKEDCTNLLPEISCEENLTIQEILEKKNAITKKMENQFSEIKKILDTEQSNKQLSSKKPNKNNDFKRIFLENELNRINKENLCLKMELCLIYQEAKKNGQLIELRAKDIKMCNEYFKGEECPLICFEINKDNRKEKFMIIKDYLEKLKKAEFIL